jgi:ankyrin repeat protein
MQDEMRKSIKVLLLIYIIPIDFFIRLHHACALQRFHLVQLYLLCLDFKIESKDCEGNTCLHYVAITGNCEIAELLMRSAEKTGIRLDQYVNREGNIFFPFFSLFINN